MAILKAHGESSATPYLQEPIQYRHSVQTWSMAPQYSTYFFFSSSLCFSGIIESARMRAITNGMSIQHLPVPDSSMVVLII